METDQDERFKSSDFLKFLKNVQSGKYELKNNELIVNNEPKYKDIKSNQDFIDYVKDTMKMETNFENIQNAEEQNMFNDVITEEDIN